MNTTHLDKQAALRWQWGEASDAERGHVASCAACRTQVEPLAEALSGFALVAREWGDAKAAAAQELRPAKAVLSKQWRGMAVTWAAAGALLLIIFGIGLPRWQNHQVTQQAAAHRQQREQQFTQDDALLDAIDQDVSQVVPHALSPLSGDSAGGSSQSQQ
jgi:hypothetical protein